MGTVIYVTSQLNPCKGGGGVAVQTLNAVLILGKYWAEGGGGGGEDGGDQTAGP